MNIAEESFLKKSSFSNNFYILINILLKNFPKRLGLIALSF